MQYLSEHLAKTINSNGSPHSGLFAIAVICGFGLVVALFLFIIARQKKAMADFAAKNGWQALGTDDATLERYVPSYLRSNSRSISHKFDMAYRAQVSGQDIVFFKYTDDVRSMPRIQYVQMEGRQGNASELIPYAIAAFTVPQTFGTLFVFHHSRLDNAGHHQGLQKFNLEGDFSSHFDVYAPPGSAIETLSVLTPDLMTLLIDLGQHWHSNIQISGNTVIIEADAQTISPSKVTDLLNYAATLKQKLAAKPLVQSAQSSADSLVGPPQQPPTPVPGQSPEI